MDYRMSGNYEEEILRLNKRVRELLTYSEKAAADNTKLLTENRDLKVHCNKYHQKYHNLREIHFKNQFRIQELEDARDSINELNKRLKINNNKYLDMIRKQNERVKQMENSMKVQMMRGGSLKEDSSADLKPLQEENDRLQRECHELQEKLNESYNIIDELEFELETLDFVEADRDHLQQELKDTRAALEELRSSATIASDRVLFNRFSSLGVGGGDDTLRDEEEAPVDDGSTESGEEEKPAFAAFAVVATEEEDEPDSSESGSKKVANSGGKSVGEEAAAEKRANEWKLRRQELQKRLETLHQRQQI